MSYCINPACSEPKNPPQTNVCRACGSQLLLGDRYQVIKTLGQGGFGATFLAADLSLPGQPKCVIKQLRPSENAPDVFQMARELFEREAETLGRIGNYPQLPRLLDYFEDKQQFYLVQEYVSGRNLQQELKHNGPLSEAGVKQFLSEILPILQYIHSQQVIHRDIKPANLIRREEDRKLVLIDFGAVKNQVNPGAAASTSELTALTAFAIGTPGYAPPEQMTMRPVYASDIYALGVTCIYLLTGKSPKDLGCDPSTGELVWEKYVDVSEHFAKVLKIMLEVSVRHRYKSAGEVLKALEMEPYLASLNQSLLAKPSLEEKSTGNLLSCQSLNSPDPQVSHTSATAKLARAIRARRARSRKKVPTQLDANTIMRAYFKGRRDFTNQNLNHLDLQRANLSGVIFHQSKLMKVNLQGADLSSADFGRAILNQAVLRNANLSRAYLSYTDLEGADLRGADLSFAHLKDANLKGANLCGANLTHASVSEKQLGQAKTNWTTILPNGKRGLW